MESEKTVGMCRRHGQPLAYLCQQLQCGDSEPLCQDQACILAHSHNAELKLVSLAQIATLLARRKENNKKAKDLLQDRLERYHFNLRKGFQKAITNEIEDNRTLDKAVFQSDIGAEGAKSIKLILKGQAQQCSKQGLCEVFTMLSSEKNQNLAQTKEIQNQINRKIEGAAAHLGRLFGSAAFKNLFRFNILSAKDFERVGRFKDSQSSWSFETGKIDAIALRCEFDMLIKGFVHFQLIECHEEEVSLRVKIFEGDNELVQHCVKVPKKVAMEGEFEVAFEEPFLLAGGKEYDLLSENTGGNFRGKHGCNLLKSEQITFAKSKRDTNGTSLGSGQFGAFIMSKLL